MVQKKVGINSVVIRIYKDSTNQMNITESPTGDDVVPEIKNTISRRCTKSKITGIFFGNPSLYVKYFIDRSRCLLPKKGTRHSSGGSVRIAALRPLSYS